MEDIKHKFIMIRVSPVEIERITEAMKLACLNRSAWMRKFMLLRVQP
jgi:hypothetical protein